MPLISTTGGRQFFATDGQSLLDAALEANVALGYSCRTGRCSSCKSRVRSGSTTALHCETGLTDEEREAGWILSCVRSATSDVSIEVEELGDAPKKPIRTWPCRIDSIELLTPDVVKVRLRLPAATAFDFIPGQYVEVIGHGGLRRSYSLASAPMLGQPIELHVRRVSDGAMSRYWFEQAKTNDLLRLKGPLGTFFLRGDEGVDLVFLATGTGIAPIKAMLEGLNASPDLRLRSLAVYWGGRSPSDVYWQPPMTAVQMRFVPVLSRADESWAGARGHVQDVFLKERPELQRAVVYACGSDVMIRSARQRLVSAGLPERRFYSDSFVCSAPVGDKGDCK